MSEPPFLNNKRKQQNEERDLMEEDPSPSPSPASSSRQNRKQQHGSPLKKNRKNQIGASSSDEEEGKEEPSERQLCCDIKQMMMEGGKESDEEDSAFLLLPDELWLMIFAYLTLLEKSRCSMVCHHFWKWASDRILYRTVDFSPYPNHIGSFRLTSFAAQAKTIDVEVLNLRGCANIIDKDMEFVTSRWNKLAVINLEGCSKITKHTLQYISMRCPRLRSLNLIGCDVSSFNPVINLLQSRKQPIELHLSSHTFEGASYPGFRSQASALETAITFSNQTDKCAEVVWVDFKGDTRVYHRLNPGKFYSQHTFETHYWLMREFEKPDNIFLHTVGTARPHVAEAVSPPVSSSNTIVHPLYLPSHTAPIPICVPSGSLYSKGDKRSLTITFKNTTDCVYLLYWLGFDGEENLKGELAGDQECVFDSFGSHVWRVKEKLTLDTYAEIILTGDSIVVQL